MWTKTRSAHVSAPFCANVDGAEGYHDSGSGGKFPEWLDIHTTFLERSGSSLGGTAKIAGMMVPVYGMVLHGRIEGWHE